MIGYVDTIEIVLRGAAAGVCFLMAGLILFSGAPRMRRITGALFLWGTVVYVLISSEDPIDILGPLTEPLKPFAVFNSVFFWWYVLSLFDDAFRFTWRKLAPFFIIAILHYVVSFVVASSKPVEQVLHNIVVISLVAHTVWIALHNRADDLVDPRRQFRLAFAIIIGATTLIIALLETYFAFNELPGIATRLQAAAVATLSFFFAFWILRPSQAFYMPDHADEKITEPQRGEINDGVSVADKPAYERLQTMMDDGVYRQEGLTVAVLAEKVGVPEHQLRKLINGALGYRNFSSFLNARRIEDAMTALSDPENARKQVLQIALDLGYGSIAPFNRAFKQSTGQTPTEYRKEALGVSGVTSENL